MRRDRVWRAIRYDALLVEFGNQECNHLRGEYDIYQIRVMLRRFGRLKLTVCKHAKLNPSKTGMTKLIFTVPPIQFVRGIEMMANCDKLGEQYLMYPTAAQNMFTVMKALCEKLAVQFIDGHQDDLTRIVDNFIRSLSVGYKNQLSRAAAESHNLHRRHKIVELSSKDAIKEFLKYLADIRVENYNTLVQEKCPKAYVMLLKATMSSIQVFNRRRPGDVERITWPDYDAKKQMESVQQFGSLHDNLQDIAKEFYLLTTRGKLGRDVRLLLPADVFICLEKIREIRPHMGFSKDNNYIFGMPTSTGKTKLHLKAYFVMRQFAIDSGIQNYHLLTATNLRKQLATACIELDLTDAQLTDLARYMGHHPDVHRSVYRQGITDRDIPTFLEFVNTALGVNKKRQLVGNDSSLEHSSQSLPAQEHNTFGQDQESMVQISAIVEDEPLPLASLNVAKGSKKIPWTEREKNLMKETYGDYLHRQAAAPSLPTLKKFMKENEEIINPRRAADGLKTCLACESTRMEK
ncbi:hypothetical protein QAD02_005749 [Eretmocerus hayati]|uniref:Uncharacterized protein n=1 Tax=Eretmocerus hayati TaxID=131215 RepID=A0ACC2NW91_9HYME|nr:hypothetical protein QAD02_005749 [Eretmocerus hayati]